jgi:hypothetical protein
MQFGKWSLQQFFVALICRDGYAAFHTSSISIRHLKSMHVMWKAVDASAGLAAARGPVNLNPERWRSLC